MTPLEVHDAAPSDAFWDRIQRSAPPPKPPKPPTSDREGGKSSKARNRRVERVLDALGFLLWTYLFVKVFVFDIDRWALHAINPALESLADYRIVVYALLLVVAIALTRRRWWRLLYVLFFPLVVVFWKTPRFLYRRRSWPFFLACLQTIASVSIDLRYRLLAALLFLASAVLILFSDAPFVLVPSAATIGVLTTISIGKYFKRTVATPSFTAMQRTWITRVLRNDHLAELWQLPDDLRDPSIDRYSDTQLQAVTMRISMGIVINKVIAVWATKLDEYRRRYAPALVFSAISFVWLFLTVLAAIALINMAIFKVAPDEYRVGREPSVFSFLVHSLGTMMGSQTGGIEAVGDLALAISLAGGLVGLLALLAIVLNVGLTLRRERDEASTKALADELRSRAIEQEGLFVKTYEVGVDEARRRLEGLGANFGLIVTWVMRVIASGVDEAAEASDSA